mgnify:CR=1 FL=1
MKKICLLTLGVIFAMNISAQDLGVESIIVKSKVDTGWAAVTNDTIFTNDTVYLGVLLKNHGSRFIDITDSIAFAVSINGTPAGTYGVVVGKNVTPLAGDNTAELIIKKDQLFPTPVAGAEICAWPVFWSKGSMGGSTANDTACSTYEVIVRPEDNVSIENVQKISSFIGFSSTELTFTTGKTVSDLKIFDLTGKVVSTSFEVPSNTIYSHDISELQSGVYIATFGTEYYKFSK